MSTVRNERISFLANARIIGIVLVVLGHSYPFGVSIPAGLELLRSFLYMFHMPLFIMISGYLSVRTHRKPTEYVAARAKKLLVPYFALSLAAFVPKMLVQQYLNDSVEFSFGYLLRSELVPRENIWGHFWYIPVIFAFGVLSSLFGKRLRENRWYLGLALAATYLLLWLPETTNWFALEDIRQNLFYYILGIGMSSCGDFQRIINSRLFLLGLPAAVLLLLTGGKPAGLGAVLMIGFVLGIGSRLMLHEKPFWREVERYSFTIFLLSWPAQAVTEVLLNKLLHLPAMAVMLGMFAAGIAVPLISVKAVEWMEKYIPVRGLKAVLGM